MRKERTVLKRDPNGRFLCTEVGFFKKKRLWRFHSGEKRTQSKMDDGTYHSLLAYQQHTPVPVMADVFSKKRWWMFRNDFYWEDEGYSEAEVKVLILDRTEQKKKRVQRAIARVSQSDSESSGARQPIPDDVKTLVWQRDGGRCIKCGSQDNLEFDHVIPLSKGGSNTARNLQLLCEKCNRSKGGNIV